MTLKRVKPLPQGTLKRTVSAQNGSSTMNDCYTTASAATAAGAQQVDTVCITCYITVNNMQLTAIAVLACSYNCFM
eukprot:7289-Heterococcus_DN1.PRE.2